MSDKIFRPRIIPDSWTLKRIGDIADTGSGGTPLTTNKDYYDCGKIPWINSGEVGESKIVNTKNYITELGLENSSAKIFPKGTVLLAMYGATAGRASILDFEAATNQAICAIIPKKGYSNWFVKYYLDLLYDYLVGISSGSARDNLNQNSIQDIKIPFPDYDLQKDIASILYLLDCKIELNNRINAELESMAKTIYDYWFVQFDFPHEFKTLKTDKNGRRTELVEVKPYKSSGGKMVWNEKLKREIPEGWEVKELRTEIEIQRGISYTSKEIDGVGIPMINLNSFNLNGTYKPEGIKAYSGKFSEKNLVYPGDLLIAATDVTRNAEIIGRAILIPEYYKENLVFSMDIAKISSNNIPSSYLMMLFNSNHYHNYIKWFANGTLVLHLNLDGINRYLMEVPPKDLLDKFNDLYLSIAKRIYSTASENNQLTEIRDWLLPMLMNGQITIK
jgi:type I restriction enzyme S subunit